MAHEGSALKSKGRASIATRIAVLTWRSLLIMSRDWKYFWNRLVLYMLLTVSVGTIFLNIGHTLSSVMVRVSAVFAFVSFILLLSIAGLPAHVKELKIFFHEESNKHSGAAIFLLGHLLSSIPFLFLISISTSLVFYFLVGLRDEFSLVMYFVLNIFMCLLANEGLMMVVAYVWLNTFSCVLTMVFVHVIMMLVAGYFRIRYDLPQPVWKYPVSYIAFHTFSVQGLLENEYIGTSFAVGQVRAIPGVQAVRGSYDISYSGNAKWNNLLVLFLMGCGFHVLLYILLRLHVRRNLATLRFYWLGR